MVAISNGYRNVPKPALVLVPKAEPAPIPISAPKPAKVDPVADLRGAVADLKARVAVLEGEPPMIKIAVSRESINNIIAIVCSLWNVTPGDLVGPRRARVLAVPRFAFAHLARTHCQHMSLPQIGLIIKRDHTTVLHGLRRAEQLIRDDPEFARRVKSAELALGAMAAVNNG
jgi:hypothetical protein